MDTANPGIHHFQLGDIARVLVTHAHIDHVCGLIDPTGAAYYPNAEIVIPEVWTPAAGFA